MSKHKPSQDPAHGVGSSWGSDLLCLLGVRHSGEIDERDVLGEIGEHGERDVLGVLLVSLIHLQRLMKCGIFPPLSFADHS